MESFLINIIFSVLLSNTANFSIYNPYKQKLEFSVMLKRVKKYKTKKFQDCRFNRVLKFETLQKRLNPSLNLLTSS